MCGNLLSGVKYGVSNVRKALPVMTLSRLSQGKVFS